MGPQLAEVHHKLMGSLMWVHITASMYVQAILLGSDVWGMEMGTADSRYWLVHQPQFRPNEEFKCNPRQFLARREANSDFEIEICPCHQILVWRCLRQRETFYEMDPWGQGAS